MKFLATLTNLLPMLGAGNDEEGISSLVNTAYDKFKNIINIVLPVALGVVLLVGTVYAIILGVRYSKAEDADKREEAKKHLQSESLDELKKANEDLMNVANTVFSKMYSQTNPNGNNGGDNGSDGKPNGDGDPEVVVE